MRPQATRNNTLKQPLAVLNAYPRHFAIAGGILLLIMASFFIEPNSDSGPEITAESNAVTPTASPLKKTPITESKAEARTTAPLEITLTPKPESPPEEIAEATWQEIKIRNGDTLSDVFQMAKLNNSALYEVLYSDKQAKLLAKIKPGQTIAFRRDEKDLLQAVKLTKNPLEHLLVERNENGDFTSSNIILTPEIRTAYRHGTLKISLYGSGKKAGLSDNLLMEMANVFGGVIDFVFDPRPGDTFAILYEEFYLDGEFLNNGRILAASYSNRGKHYEAYRYQHADSSYGYYDAEGISMRKAFLRAPVDFTRISSNFNPRRLHPILKTKRPHRGVDYAAATGTPVYAAGDGRVVASGYSKSNGNYVTIKHGEAYTTKYLHLNKRKVKKGQRVKQKKIIGTVGSTGLATGPHLHYEFLVNGVHRNPRTIIKKLPKAKSLAKQQLADFDQKILPIRQQFHAYQQVFAQDNDAQPTRSKGG